MKGAGGHLDRDVVERRPAIRTPCVMPIVSSDGPLVVTAGAQQFGGAHASAPCLCGDDRDRAAAVRALMLGAAGDIDLAHGRRGRRARRRRSRARDGSTEMSESSSIVWRWPRRRPVEPASALASRATRRARSGAAQLARRCQAERGQSGAHRFDIDRIAHHAMGDAQRAAPARRRAEHDDLMIGQFDAGRGRGARGEQS